MSDQAMARDRDLVLPPNTFAFVLDSTKGKVSVYVGPYKASLSSTDKLVVWDDGRKQFTEVRDLEAAINTFSRAGEGQYVVLTDPAKQGAQSPPTGNSTEAVELNVGRSVIIPGPASFPLWPGQVAKTIDGHHLRHNQYLVVRVTNPDLAKENWSSAVVAPQTASAISPVPSDTVDGSSDEGQGDVSDGFQQGPSAQPTPPQSLSQNEHDHVFTMGQLIVIKGTEVSFYIPSTGLEVVPEEGSRSTYVREAATLEQLEYCILLDESGTKRYVHGPAVVFPEPTETFIASRENGGRKFKAIELDDRTGIYVKVIQAYTEDDVHHPVGEELFISGAQNAIYYPRPEHSIIEYDGKKRHFAVAIPAGEGRYVLNRETGQIDLVTGPKMFLPDPRTQVVVKRILDARTVELLYPGNQEAQDVNREYRRMSDELSPGEYLESRDRGSSLRGDTRYDDGRLGAEFPSETSRRTTAHTPPRTIVLDNKYDGAVSVSIWPGYAVLVTNKTGRRRVEVGPKVILLDYDEILMPMELSTGKPKTTDHLIRTAYLRTANNQVSDIVTVETRDLVRVEIKLSLRANFEAQNEVGRQKWFDVENYVKLLTDHVRSRLRRIAKGYGIQEFYRDTIDIVRNEILGEVPADGQRRPGMLFEECGLRVYDVEILQVSISDHNVAALLQDAQSHALEGAIRLSQAEDESRQLRASEELARANLRFRHETTEARAALEAEALALELRSRLAKVHAALEEAREQRVVTELEMGMEMRRANQRVQIQKAANEAELERLREEATIYVTRMAAINEQFGQALQNFGDKSFVEALVTSLGPVAATMGLTSGDLLKQVFEGTPFSGVLESLSDRPFRAGQRAIAGS